MTATGAIANESKQDISEALQRRVAQYKEAHDPLYMMGLLFDFASRRADDLSEEDWRQIAGCYNMLAAMVRNE
jgi:hypothetical protein